MSLVNSLVLTQSKIHLVGEFNFIFIVIPVCIYFLYLSFCVPIDIFFFAPFPLWADPVLLGELLFIEHLWAARGFEVDFLYSHNKLSILYILIL